MTAILGWSRMLKLGLSDEEARAAIWNLLANAIKFTPRGGSVTLRLSQNGSLVRLIVSDTGEGIERSFLPYVFEPFRQADSSTTRPHGGIGLGLAIVRSLVEMHGGRGALVVIGQPVLAAVVGKALGHAHYIVRVASTGQEAGSAVADWSPHLVVLDMDIEGNEMLKRFAAATLEGGFLPVIA